MRAYASKLKRLSCIAASNKDYFAFNTFSREWARVEENINFSLESR